MSTLGADPLLELLGRVAEIARELGIETALIGAVAMAAHNYVRGTIDADLATDVDPRRDLSRLRDALAQHGFQVQLNLPDDEDPLGGVLRVWQHEDEEGSPLDPIDVVNFHNPYRAGARNPGHDAVREALPIAGTPLRCVRLAELIALKLYAGALRDEADVFELLVRNPDANFDEIEAVCTKYGLEGRARELIAKARSTPG